MEMKKKLFKKIVIACLAIMIIEALLMLVIKITREREIINYDGLNDIIVVDDGYVAVGSSDFTSSSYVDKKIYNYENKKIIATQAKIAKYDKDFKLLFEGNYENDYDSNFYGVIKVSDGFIAVGSIVQNEQQIKDNVSDALIVKFNQDFKVIWQKTYSVLSDTEFYKIIDDGDDNYVIIGQSIYENMEVGNHITGGGIIVRINKDGEIIAHNNYGGNKSGIFNDIIKVSDGYIVCGKDATNYGILVKFKKDFDREETDTNLITKKTMWQRTYSNTDTEGFTSMVLVGDTIYASGAINISDEKDADGNPIFKYDAGIVLYNTAGKYLGKKITANDDAHNLFTSIVTDNEYLYLIKLIDVDNTKTNKKSVLVKYDLEGNLVNKEENNSNNNYLLNKIIRNNSDFLLIGMSDTKCGFIHGCDYEPIIKVYNNELKAK